MRKKTIKFPYRHEKHGRVGTIYKLGNGTFKTYFKFAQKPRTNTHASFGNALEYLESEFTTLDNDRGNSQSEYPLARDKKYYWELEQRLKQESDSASLWQAVDFFLTFHKKKAFKPMAVDECVAKFLASRLANNAAPLQIKTLKKHFKRFQKEFGARKIDSIDSQEIADWLDGCKDIDTGNAWSPKTKRSVRGSLVSLARYARKNLKAIPSTGEETEFEKVPRPKVVRSQQVEIYTPEELQKLLNAAIEKDVDLIPIIILGAQMGLRPTEAHGEDVERERLPWEAFDWEESSVTLFNQKVRTNRPRTINVQDAAKKWLEPFKKLKGPIWTMKSSHDRRYAAVRKAAGVEAIIDGLRHSYASFRIKQLKGNLEELAEEMGNSPEEITRSYKRGVTTDASTKWFSVMPPKGYERKIEAALSSRKPLRPTV